MAMRPEDLRSAVAQLGALVEHLAAGADELAVDPRVDRGRREGGYPVTVLKSQNDIEVSFEGTSDSVAGQCPKKLATGLLIGWRYLVLPEGCVRVLGLVVGGCRDYLPGVGQGVADNPEEPGVVELAALGGGEHVGRNVERHKTSWIHCSYPDSHS
jgi:hypothetical protein